MIKPPVRAIRHDHARHQTEHPRVCLIVGFGLSDTAMAQNLAADYAFLILTTVSPDFAAANYTIRNEGGADVNTAISRLPFRFDLMTDTTRQLQLEVALAAEKNPANGYYLSG